MFTVRHFNESEHTVVFETLWGSKLYGTNMEGETDIHGNEHTSDHDVRIVYVTPLHELIMESRPPVCIIEGDVRATHLNIFLHNLHRGCAGELEMIYSTKAEVHDLMRPIVAARDIFYNETSAKAAFHRIRNSTSAIISGKKLEMKRIADDVRYLRTFLDGMVVEREDAEYLKDIRLGKVNLGAVYDDMIRRGKQLEAKISAGEFRKTPTPIEVAKLAASVMRGIYG